MSGKRFNLINFKNPLFNSNKEWVFYFKMLRKKFKTSVILTFIIISLHIPADAQEDQYSLSRKYMVENDLKGRGINDKKVISVMVKVPRHLFVDKRYRNRAYADYPLPIGEGQTISQPYIVAFMTQVLNVKKDEKVLEIGTGSGYQAAILYELGAKVFSIEIREKLYKRSEEILKTLGYYDIKLKSGDGYFGWEEYAPYDAVIVTAAVNHIPPPLIKQLKKDGRLILPLGSTTYYQTLTLIKKINDELKVEHLLGVSFVPMIGESQKR